MNWQPIETAPKDGTWVLGYFPMLGVSQMKWFSYGSYTEHWMRFGGWTPVDNPTHWMPLPEPPHEKTPPTEADGAS
jgi:hypothetical protein